MALVVIGAGMPRTGTSSLKNALEQLGFGPCYHMAELMQHQERKQFFIDAANGKSVDWDAAFEGYRSTTDAPANGFYKQLMAKYPNAKVILSLRDPEAWFASTQETILQPFVMKIHEAMGTLEMCNKIGWGDDPKLRDKSYMLARFKTHNEDVLKTVPKEKLLVFEAKQGWAPLCAFLGVPVPHAPYPHANARGDFGASMSEEQRRAFEEMSPEEVRQAVQAMVRDRVRPQNQH